MKKILLILVLCLSTIGLAGCGNKLPDKVELTPENNYSVTVGADIKEGKKYYLEIEGDFENELKSQGFGDDDNILMIFSNNNQSNGIILSMSEISNGNTKIAIDFKVENNDIISIGIRDNVSSMRYDKRGFDRYPNNKFYIISE